jgi:flagellar biosynthesis protein
MSDEVDDIEPQDDSTPVAPLPTSAIALRYDPTRDSAPVIVATGQYDVAEEILTVARRHNIPIREDKALAGVLAGLDLGSYIPPEMYRAVAEVLSWVYRMENTKR